MAQRNDPIQKLWAISNGVASISVFTHLTSRLALGPDASLSVFSYRGVFIGTTAAYSFIVLKLYLQSRRNPNKPFSQSLWWQETTPTLLMSTVWALTPPFSLAVLSFPTYSTYHTLTQIQHFLLRDSVYSATSQRLSDSIKHFIKSTFHSAMYGVMTTEIVLWFGMLWERPSSVGTVVAFGSYTLFLCYRLANFGKQYPDTVKELKGIGRRWGKRLFGTRSDGLYDIPEEDKEEDKSDLEMA